MVEEDRVRTEDANSSSADEIKSRILDRISKEVDKSKARGKGSEFQIITGDPGASESPVMATYYKGGSYVKIN